MNDLADRLAVDAWAPDVIDDAARLDPHGAELQRVLDAAKRHGVRIRDWRAAVTRRRVALDDERRSAARRAAPAPEGDDLDSRIAFVRSRLLSDEKGNVRKVVANVITILGRDPRWDGHLAFHAMRDAPIITTAIEWHEDDAPAKPYVGPWTDADSVRAASWLSRVWDLDVAPKLVSDAIEAVSRRVLVDPLRDYLGALRWDGHVRLPGFLSAYFGAEDSEYTRAVGTRWMISAVARALNPGCKVDCVLVLEGPQGSGKSTALRKLCPSDDLFCDDELPLGSKDAAQNLAGKWIYELGELDKLSRHDLGTLKAFVTRQTDTYRPSFGIRARDFDRWTVFAASVNGQEYLRDDENRRYWPVRAPHVFLAELERDRDQLWAEAVVRYQSGEPWHVDTPELASLCRAEQELRRESDPWEEHVAKWLAGQAEQACQSRILGARCPCAWCQGVTSSAVLSGALNVERSKQGRGEEMRAAAVMRRLGWRKSGQKRQDGGVVRPYFPPAPREEVTTS